MNNTTKEEIKELNKNNIDNIEIKNEEKNFQNNIENNFANTNNINKNIGNRQPKTRKRSSVLILLLILLSISNVITLKLMTNTEKRYETVNNYAREYTEAKLKKAQLENQIAKYKEQKTKYENLKLENTNE